MRLVPNTALRHRSGPAGLAQLVGALVDARHAAHVEIALDLSGGGGGAPVPVPELALRLTGPGFADAMAVPRRAGGGASLLAVAGPYVEAAVRWATAPAPDGAGGVTVVRAYGPTGEAFADVLVRAAPALAPPPARPRLRLAALGRR